MRKISLLCVLILTAFAGRASGQTTTTIGGRATLSAPAALPVTVTLAPPAATVATNSTQTFVLTVTNDMTMAGANLTLSCTGACGTLSTSFARSGASITYTAPSSANSVVLTATSAQDPSRFVIVPITVTSTTPPAVVNFVATPTSQASASTNTFAIPSTVGSSVIVAMAVATGDTVSGVQVCNPLAVCTSLTQTCPPVGACFGSTTPGGNSYQFYGVNLLAGQTSVVVSNSVPSGSIDIGILDVSGLGGLETAAIASSQTTATTNPTGPSVIPPNAGDLLVGNISSTGTVSAAGAPYTFAALNGGDGMAYTLATTTTSISPSYTSTSGTWSGMQAAYRIGIPGGAIRVTLAPTVANVQVNDTQSFIATYTNDTANAGGTNTLSGGSCTGATCGTLSTTTSKSGVSFLYTAPSTIPGASVSRIQGPGLTGTSNTGSATQTITASGSGHMLCGIAVWNTLAGTLTVSDSAAQTYTQVITGNGNGISATMACKANTASGVTSLSYTVSGASPPSMEFYALEYAGVATVSPVDQSTSTSATANPMDSGFNPTTTNATDLLVGFGYNGASLTFTAGNDGHGDSYSLVSQNSFIGSAVEDFFPTTTTNTYKATLVPATTSGSRMFVVAFKASAGGSSAVTLTSTSVTDNTKSATATINIGTSAVIGVSVAPSTASVVAGSSPITFTATVTNDPPAGGVTWGLGGVGTLTQTSSTTVTYTPPASVSSTQSFSITATSNGDNTKTGSAFIIVSQPGGGGGTGTGSSVCNPNCPAFAGAGGNAQGAGADATGGRGGQVYNVNVLTDGTNLYDPTSNPTGCHFASGSSSPGTTGNCSLRDCIQDTAGATQGLRNCIFRVTGLMTQKSRMQISKGGITVAGQTSPGGGIVQGGANQVGEGIFISAPNVIYRYMTYDGAASPASDASCNHNPNPGAGGGTVGIEIASNNNHQIILDHLSHRWWGNKDFEPVSNGPGQNAHDFTIQWTLGYEPCVDHHVVTEPDTFAGGSVFASVNQDGHHNLFMNYDHRCPLLNIRSLRWVNVVCYNGLVESQSFNWSGWGAIQADIIGSKFLDGPQSSNPVYEIVDQRNSSVGDQADCAIPTDTCDNGSIQGRYPSFYLLNNQGHAGTNTGGPLITATNVVNDAGELSMTAEVDAAEGATNPRAMPNSCVSNAPGTANCWFRSTPLPPEIFPITADQVTNLDNVLTPTVGNSQHLDCLGNFVSNRDSQDARVIQQYLVRGPGGDWAGPNYTGKLNSDGTPAAGPAVVQGTACVESLGDGIPDQWKVKFNLSTTDTTLYKTPDPVTKLTYLEDYLDGLIP